VFEWSLACYGCIIATSVDCRNHVRYSLTSWSIIAKFENVSFFYIFATRRCMMEARLKGKDVSA